MSPTDVAFRRRLGLPDPAIADKEQRAINAGRYCLAALQAGDEATAADKWTRMLRRWQERDELEPAGAEVWQQRHETVSALFAAIDDTHPLAEAVTQQFYTTLARASGEDRETAEGYGWTQTRQWFR